MIFSRIPANSPGILPAIFAVCSAVSLIFAFNELNMNCVCANILEDNEQSVRFHKRVFFSDTGRIRDKIYTNGKYKDVLCFSITKAEFLSNFISCVIAR